MLAIGSLELEIGMWFPLGKFYDLKCCSFPSNIFLKNGWAWKGDVKGLDWENGTILASLNFSGLSNFFLKKNEEFTVWSICKMHLVHFTISFYGNFHSLLTSFWFLKLHYFWNIFPIVLSFHSWADHTSCITSYAVL